MHIVTQRNLCDTHNYTQREREREREREKYVRPTDLNCRWEGREGMRDGVLLRLGVLEHNSI